VVLGGAVQDFVILFASMRRDGKSLGQMAKEEVGPVTGLAAMIAILAIMIILLAVLALVVVNALRDSPWGMFTIACTVPIALLMGFWMKVSGPAGRSKPRWPGSYSSSPRWWAAATWPVGDPGPALHPRRAGHRLGDHHLRIHRQRPPGLDAAPAARLPLHLHEDRHHHPARLGPLGRPDPHAGLTRFFFSFASSPSPAAPSAVPPGLRAPLG
jgi:hypothetical protein